MRITSDGIRSQTKTKSYPMKLRQLTTPFLMRINLCGYRQMAGQLRPTSVWPPMTLHYYQAGKSPLHWPAIICPSSSTLNCPRLMRLGEPTSTSSKRTGHAMLKPAMNTLPKMTKQELSNKPRRPSVKQWIRPLASSFRPAAFDTSNQPCRHQPNRSPMNKIESANETLNL